MYKLLGVSKLYIVIGAPRATTVYDTLISLYIHTNIRTTSPWIVLISNLCIICSTALVKLVINYYYSCSLSDLYVPRDIHTVKFGLAPPSAKKFGDLWYNNHTLHPLILNILISNTINPRRRRTLISQLFCYFQLNM